MAESTERNEQEGLDSDDIRLLYGDQIDETILDSMLINLGLEQTFDLLDKFTHSMPILKDSSSDCSNCRHDHDELMLTRSVDALIKFLQQRERSQGIDQVIRDRYLFSDQFDKLRMFRDAILPIWKSSDNIQYQNLIDDANYNGYFNMIEFYLNHFLTSSENSSLAEQVIKASDVLLLGYSRLSTVDVPSSCCSQARLLLVLHSILAEFISPGYAMEINRAARLEAIDVWSNGQVREDLPNIMEANSVDTTSYDDDEPFLPRDLM